MVRLHLWPLFLFLCISNLSSTIVYAYFPNKSIFHSGWTWAHTQWNYSNLFLSYSVGLTNFFLNFINWKVRHLIHFLLPRFIDGIFPFPFLLHKRMHEFMFLSFGSTLLLPRSIEISHSPLPDEIGKQCRKHMNGLTNLPNRENLHSSFSPASSLLLSCSFPL